MLNSIFLTLARWRTWIVNVLLALAFAMPEILNSPEVLAVIPAEWQRWFLVAAFLANIWMRPRPAVLPNDPEAQYSRAIKSVGPYDEYKAEP